MRRAEPPVAAPLRLRGVVFEATARCNLRCLYCYNPHKAPGGPAPASEGYRRARRTLERLFEVAECDCVTMSGGEPFLAERFPELALFCRMRGKRVVVISNGAAAEADAYRMLIDVGVVTYELPLHADRADEHDAMVGREGTWARVRRSIDVVLGAGGSVIPVVVVTRMNAGRVAGTLRLFRDLGLRRVMLNRFNVGGAGVANAESLALPHDQLRSVFREADDLARRYGLTISSNVCTPVCVLDPKAHSRIRFAACAPDPSRKPLTLDAEGNLRVCNHSPRRLGNIFTDELGAILKGEGATRWETLRPPRCAECARWPECYGGCRAASEQLGRDLDCADPILDGAAGGAPNLEWTAATCSR